MTNKCVSYRQDLERAHWEISKYHILDTPPETCYDDIVCLAASLYKCPIAFLAFIDFNRKRLFLKSKLGIEFVHLPISVDYNYEMILHDKPIMIVDTLEMEPRIYGISDIRFYTAVPLSVRGQRLGTICLCDYIPREDLLKQGIESLERLGRQVISQLGLRLSVETLKNKNKLLRKVCEEKSKILELLSHDIRQPLINITASSEVLLRDSELSTQGHLEFVQTNYANARFMTKLVDELLHTVKLDFNTTPLNFTRNSVELVSFVHGIVKKNLVAANRKSIVLKFKALGTDHYDVVEPVPPPHDDKPVESSAESNTISDMRALVESLAAIQTKTTTKQSITCCVNYIKMEQVINNLISNAIKFSHPNSSIKIKVGAKDNKTAFISVRDYGLGIPSDEIPNLFKPFEKVSVKPTGGETSTGLGLAIVRNIVVAHGGQMNVKSSVGQGSKFEATIPMTDSDDDFYSAEDDVTA
ncbi:sensor histidine kinase ResE [Acrasis kona]|uniref:histidine kinase n=1 Tax=Acrasis kona TaxID=1008807 RepID=A0AAW2ZG37_9EUKA